MCVRANKRACVHACERACVHVFIARFLDIFMIFYFICEKALTRNDDEPSIVQSFIMSLSSECLRRKKKKQQLTKPYFQTQYKTDPPIQCYIFMMYDCMSTRTVWDTGRPRNRWMIAMADNLIDIERIKKSCKLSNTLEWFDSLCAMDAHRNIDAKMLLSKFQKIARTQIHTYIQQPTKKNHIKIKIKTKKRFFCSKISVTLNEFMVWCALSSSLSLPCVIFSALLLIMKMLILILTIITID